jgi:hypothetical protein
LGSGGGGTFGHGRTRAGKAREVCNPPIHKAERGENPPVVRAKLGGGQEKGVTYRTRLQEARRVRTPYPIAPRSKEICRHPHLESLTDTLHVAVGEAPLGLAVAPRLPR